MKELPIPHTTARELLEIVAGEEHALHSVAKRDSASKNTIVITCSCGEIFKVPASAAVTLALRNVAVKD